MIKIHESSEVHVEKIGKLVGRPGEGQRSFEVRMPPV